MIFNILPFCLKGYSETLNEPFELKKRVDFSKT